MDWVFQQGTPHALLLPQNYITCNFMMSFGNFGLTLPGFPCPNGESWIRTCQAITLPIQLLCAL